MKRHRSARRGSNSSPMAALAEATAAASETMRELVASGSAPAVSAAVVVQGRVVFAGAAGSAGGEPCTTEGTLFYTASISKTVTALACLQAAERGELNIDADVSTYVGQRVRNPHFEEAVLTLRHLLQHRSGLSDSEAALLPGRWRSESGECETTLAEYVRERLLPGGGTYEPLLWSRDLPPGQAGYHYSNAGFALAGWVLECATGRSLASLATERVFEPLGMGRSAFSLREATDGRGTVAAPSPPGRVYGVAEYPAAALLSTAADLSRYLLALTAPPEACPLLLPASLRELLPESFTGGLAWWGRDSQYGDRRGQLWSHGGFMQGVRTHTHVWPLERAATVVLTNGESEAGKDAVAAALRRVALAAAAAAAD